MLQSNHLQIKMLLLLPLMLLLVACATSSLPPAVACPILPLPPVAHEPQPSTPYLESAQKDVSKWQQMLKDSELTQ